MHRVTFNTDVTLGTVIFYSPLKHFYVAKETKTEINVDKSWNLYSW